MQIEVDHKMGGAAIIIQFAPDEVIHQCMLLPGLAKVHVGKPLVVGKTPAQSKANLVAWLDAIISKVSPSGNFVRNLNGIIQPGYYDHLKTEESIAFLAQVNAVLPWVVDIFTANLSCGSVTIFTSDGIDEREDRLHPMITGPFQSWLNLMNTYKSYYHERLVFF